MIPTHGPVEWLHRGHHPETISTGWSGPPPLALLNFDGLVPVTFSYWP